MIDLMNNIGIYKLYYTGSDKFYIGSTSRSFKERLRVHISELRKGKHHNQPLQRGYIKYGEEALVMEPIILCNREGLLELEEFAIRCMKPSYNASKSGSTRRGVKASKEAVEKMAAKKRGKRLTDEHKANISAGLLKSGYKVSEEHKDKLRRLMTGRTVSPETREKIRQYNIGKKQSEEIVEKRSRALRKAVNLNKYLFVHDDGTEVYETLYYMKITYNLNSHVHGLVSGKRNVTKGWRIKQEQ